MCESSEAFKQGVKDFREGKAKTVRSVTPLWVKCSITVREWNAYFKNISNY